MLDLLKEYMRPNDKINELVKKGELITLKKGLYVTGPKLNLPRPESFLVANHLWGPSYVSLDAALSYWGFIPEKAICDKIIHTSGILLRSQYQALEYIIQDLRIDEEMLKELDRTAIRSWIEDAPEKASLAMLVKTISRL